MKDIFITQQVNDAGCYAINLFLMGEKVKIVVDDRIPCYDESIDPCFTRNKSNEIWCLLLEKAFAKLHGSYDNIIAGHTDQALTCLTGAPSVYYDHRTTPDVVDKLYEGEKKNYIMCASAAHKEGKMEDIGKNGIVSSHAYSVLSVHKITHPDDGRLRILKLRNPWGNTEWKGDWSDDSDKWTPELKAEVGFTEENDGTFFIAERDYKKFYCQSTICHMVDGNDHSSSRVTTAKGEAVLFKVTASEAQTDTMFILSQLAE